jgi:hypothetical protein
VGAGWSFFLSTNLQDFAQMAGGDLGYRRASGINAFATLEAQGEG